MPTQIITNYFKLHNVKQFRESINETANSVYYVFAGRSLPYSAGDITVDQIVNTEDSTNYNTQENIVFGKRVGANNVCVSTNRFNWTANTIYTPYRNDVVLEGTQYYVCVNAASIYHIFKCLDNNSNAVSSSKPDASQTSPDDEFYSTADGYIWKYMYSVDATVFNNFATSDYMPVVANGQVVANATSGSIDVITVPFRGSHYNTTLSNTFISTDIRVGGNPVKYNIVPTASANNLFYQSSFIYIASGTGAGQGRKIVDYVVVANTKTITIETAFNTVPSTDSVYEITPSVLILGDGDDAVARAIVNTSISNSIYQVQIINRGRNYTYATAEVLGNTGGVSNNAVLNVVMGPKGGHGSDPEYELGSSVLVISSKFSNNEIGTIPTENDFRTIGLIKDPLFANVGLTVNSIGGSFLIGENVIQANTLATGKVTEFDAISSVAITNVSGVFIPGKTITGTTSNSTANVVSFNINGKSKGFDTFDQRARFAFRQLSDTHKQDEFVYQTAANGAFSANGYFHSQEGSVNVGTGLFEGNLYLTHVRGTLNTGNTLVGNTSGAVATLLFKYPPDLSRGSGEIIYVENLNAVTRSNNQSETVKIILKF